jgi:hypothetical protein
VPEQVITAENIAAAKAKGWTELDIARGWRIPPAEQGRQDATVYRPDGLVLSRYLLSTASMACIQGPVGSGKSVGSIMRLYRAILGQPKTKGKRRSRWLVTRNSYPQLEQSTIKTWLDWFPEKLYGKFAWSPPYTHWMEFGDVEAEVVFEPFGDEDSIPSLKSREYTGGWINEGQFYSRKLTMAIYERTGRFPGPGKRWLQMDMNAPPHGHWVPMMRGDAPIPEEMTEDERRALVRPDDWEFLKQPPWFLEDIDPQGNVTGYRINPEAENLAITGEAFAYDMLKARTKAEIDADLMNRVLILTPGRPVFAVFSREKHVAKSRIFAVPGLPIHVGLDFGRNPAAVFVQNVRGCWRVLGELIGRNIAAVDFAPMVKRKLAVSFPEHGPGDFLFWGDPSGADKRSEATNDTGFSVFEAHGMIVRQADRGNRRTIRIETATAVFNRLDGCLVSPDGCPMLTTALCGGYVYARKRVSGTPVYDEEPKKDDYSHPVDALLEVFMGGGESRIMLNRVERRGPVSTLRKVDPFDRGPQSRAAQVFRR